jgi:diguanylate cyclase (GGDEF)-like protein
MSQISAPERYRLVSHLRLELAIPLLLLLNFALWFHLASWIRDTAALISFCVAGSIEVLSCLLERNSSEYTAHLAVIAVFVFTNTVMRLRPPYALAVFGWGMGAECLLVAFGPRRMPDIDIFQVVLVLGIGLSTLIANYRQSREAKLASRRYMQKEDLMNSLAQSNRDLAAAARTDGLTGLANRSSLDSYLLQIWSNPSYTALECSVVMADIDHFKNINDRYGHLYGDRVITRVAHLLSEALRGQDDFIARFGGEEFIVVLPNTPIAFALIVAERLRGLVELAGLPSLRTGDPDLEGMRATISCGVAADSPGLLADPYALIGAADEALYRAKRDGRNLVR